MNRKIYAFSLALMLAFSSISISAGADNTVFEADYRIQTDSIDIMLSGSDLNSINVVITDKEKDFVIGETEFALLKELKKNTDGNFSYSALMPSSSKSGKYFITVSAGEETYKRSFWYMSEAQAEDELEIIGSSSLGSLNESQLADLGIDVEKFNTNKEKVVNAYEKFKSAGKPDKKTFLTAFTYACLFAEVEGKSNSSEVEQIYKEYSGSLGFSTAEFDSLSDNSKKWFLNKLAGGKYEKEEPTAMLKKWLCLADISYNSKDTITNYKNLLFEKYADIVVLDADDVAKYDTSAKKDNIILSFIGKRPFNDMDALKKAFGESVKAYSSSGASGNTGGGGGGGGGGSSSSVEKTTKFETTSLENTLFADVPATHWAYTQIKSMYEKGIVSGKSEGIFKPDDSVTRAEFAKIISMAFFKNNEVAGVSYNDVGSSAWYYEYVAKLSSLGIIKGDDKGNFNPDAYITREDAAVIIRRMTETRNRELPINRGYKEFSDDSSISSYAKEAVVALYEAGIINGITNSEFAPKNNLTRAQAVQLVYITMQ